MQLADRRQFSMPCGNGGKLFWWEMQQQLLSRTSGVPTPLPPFSSRRTKIDALLRFVWCVHFLFLYLSLDIRTYYIHIKRPRRLVEGKGCTALTVLRFAMRHAAFYFCFFTNFTAKGQQWELHHELWLAFPTASPATTSNRPPFRPYPLMLMEFACAFS